MGSHCLLQGISLTQESNPGLLHCRQILYWLSHQGSLSLGLLIFNFGELGELKNKNGPLGKLLKLSKSQFLIYKIEELIPALHGYRKHLDIY